MSGATEDVWLENSENKNSKSAGLLVGKAAASSKKRALVKFDLAAAGMPANATILSAQLSLKYWHKSAFSGTTPWQDRLVHAGEILVDWDDQAATKTARTATANWASEYGDIGTEINATPESSVLFQETTPLGTLQTWELTELVQRWLDTPANNHGVMLWDVNEDVLAWDLLFYSSESADPPLLTIEWVEQTESVYYLKDHLGSVRATVNEAGEVVGSDDYDPWGLTIRSTVNQPHLPNKFTGKERDTDFGLDWDYFGARYYDAEIGRWMAPDPLAGKYPSLSPYNYVASNPLQFRDPDGAEILDAKTGERIGEQVARNRTLGVIGKAFANKSDAKIDFISTDNASRDAVDDFRERGAGALNELLFQSRYSTNADLGAAIQVNRAGDYQKDRVFRTNTITANTRLHGQQVFRPSKPSHFGFLAGSDRSNPHNAVFQLIFFTKNHGQAIILTNTVSGLNQTLKKGGVNLLFEFVEKDGRFVLETRKRDKKVKESQNNNGINYED